MSSDSCPPPSDSSALRSVEDVAEEGRARTRGAGRGGLALTAGKLVFLLAGLIQQIALKALLGLAGYGALSTALSIASIAYNPMVQAGIQGVSRETARLPDAARTSALSALLRVHVLFSLLVSLIFFAFAPSLARALGATHITRAIQVLSLVLLAYGLYAPLVGALNGARRFVAQAGLDAFAAGMRTIGLLGGAALALQLPTVLTYAGSRVSGIQVVDAKSFTFVTSVQVAGTAWGFALASVVVLIVALQVARPTSRRDRLSAAAQGALSLREGPSRILGFMEYGRVVVALWAGQILLNVLFQADALLLRRFAASAAEAQFLPASDADPFVGAYRACQLFCFLPFQLLTSLTFVLFPLLAAAHAAKQTREVAHLLERGLRLALGFIGLLVSVLLGVSEGLLTLVFGAETGALGAPAMRILALGMGAFALLGVMTAALNSLGREKWSIGVFAVAVFSVVAGCVAFTRGVDLGAELLMRTAWGTSLAMLAAAVTASVLLRSLAAFRFPLLSLWRCTLAMAGSAALTAWWVPAGAGGTLAGSAGCALLYLGLLVTSRELKKDDLLGLNHRAG